jgi:hypothetical protein
MCAITVTPFDSRGEAEAAANLYVEEESERGDDGKLFTRYPIDTRVIPIDGGKFIVEIVAYEKGYVPFYL